MKNDALNVCVGDLSDHEYLKHMIPHHQVAVDISKMLQKKNKKSINATHFKKNYLGTKL